MAKRTIYDFRAENKIWLSDLSEILGIPEEEIKAFEKNSDIPKEISDKIIDRYGLAEDYFSVDTNPKKEKVEPKVPFRYFAVATCLWYIVLSLILALVDMPKTVAASFNIQNAFFTLFEEVCSVLIFTVSGVYLATYIMKKTVYGKAVTKFEYLYSYFAFKMIMVSTVISNLFYHFAFDSVKMQTVGNIVTGAVELFAVTFAVAFLIKAAVEKDEKKKTKILVGVCTAVVLVQLVNIGMYFFFAIKSAKAFDTATLVMLTVNFVLLAFTTFGVTAGTKKAPKLDTLWFKILPIVSMLLPTATELIKAFVK